MMEIESPYWMNICYIENILREAFGDESIKVSTIIIGPATSKGDNYVSDMYRITVELTRVQQAKLVQEHRSLIVKITLMGDHREKMIEKAGFFQTELSIFSEALPRLSEIIQKAYPMKLAARCFYIQYDRPTHLVVEDLVFKGFRMSYRRAGLDLDHSLLAMRNLGRFHAASITLLEEDPQAVMKYKTGLIYRDQPPYVRTLFTTTAKCFAQEVAKWPEINSRILDKLFALCDVFYEKGCESVCYREDSFNVLNHGDFWINNMLFRYDIFGNPIDHIFVDFQCCHYGSPAVDILYFLASSPNDEVHLHQREFLIREYYYSLNETMTKLRCNTDIPTYSSLQTDLKRRAFCEVFSSITALALVKLGDDEEIDFGEMLKPDSDYVNPGFTERSYRKIMTTLLPWYDSMGWLDL